jgi:hypothetical protein
MLWHKVQGAGGFGAGDPFFSDVSLLIQGSISDQSDYNHSVFTYGSVSLSSKETKFSANSVYFVGTDDVAYIPDNNAFSFGSGDFTLETWIYPTRTGANQRVLGQYQSSTYQWFLRLNSSNQLQVFWNDVSFGLTGTAVNANEWSHVACVREGSDLSLYINGSRVNQRTMTVTLANYSNYLGVGAGAASISAFGIFEEFRGYIDGFRITKGIARYSGATVAVPTDAFPIE